MAGSAACRKEEQKTILLGDSGTTVEVPKEQTKVRIVVGGMITPKDGIGYYREFLHYMQEKIGSNVEYVDRESYAEINEMLRLSQAL